MSKPMEYFYLIPKEDDSTSKEWMYPDFNANAIQLLNTVHGIRTNEAVYGEEIETGRIINIKHIEANVWIIECEDNCIYLISVYDPKLKVPRVYPTWGVVYGDAYEESIKNCEYPVWRQVLPWGIAYYFK